jgi:hypothetical protein
LYVNPEKRSVSKRTVVDAAGGAESHRDTADFHPALRSLDHAEATMNNENKTTSQHPKYQNPKNQPYSKQPLPQDDPKNQEAASPRHDPTHDTEQNKPSERHDSTRKPRGETQMGDKTKTTEGETKYLFCRNEGPRPVRATRGFNVLERRLSTIIPG